MKKLGLLIATLVLANSALADDAAVYSNLTIAAAETGSTMSWAVDKAERNADKPQTDILADQAEALNEKINAKLEKALEEKFNDQLN